MIENTADRDPALHMLGLLGGSDAYITGMEAAGQRQVVASSKRPTEGSDALADLGFTLGEIDPADPLFRDVTLPEGWSKQGSDHDMWSYVVDQHGRRRVGVFYKAAYYDRRADCHVESVGQYLSYTSYEGGAFVLDDEWCTKAAVIEDAPVALAQARKMASGRFNEDGSYTRQVERLEGLLRMVGGGT